MKGLVESLKVLNYDFSLEVDTGISDKTEYTLWIYKDNKPLFYNGTEIQARKDFNGKYNKNYLNNFCSKFANNEEYRNEILNKYI